MLLLILLAVNSDRDVEFVNKTLLHAVQTIYNLLFANIYCFPNAVGVPWLKNVIEI